MKNIFLVTTAMLLFAGCGSDTKFNSLYYSTLHDMIAIPAIPFAPRSYVCYSTDGSMSIDGNITDSEWSEAPWSELFTDIEGDIRPAPLYPTRMKMLWDDKYLYIAAELTEPHIRATLRQRDTIIFHDNDFEVFIDPDGDTHGYYEFEMNPDEWIKWNLRLLYFAQRAYVADKNEYADDSALLADYGYNPGAQTPEILVTMGGYEASLPAASKEGYIYINSTGMTWAAFTE